MLVGHRYRTGWAGVGWGRDGVGGVEGVGGVRDDHLAHLQKVVQAQVLTGSVDAKRREEDVVL